mmetsp:Transcript_69278/g.185719  ORF Transcript_69278/g.185719 Transcript_69278/m.185719 type:complete len:194 (-) Transcript_69278:1233-1814(-)
MTLHGEYGNIALLLILYTLQGIPMGLSGFMTMEIKDIFKDSFSEMGTFSLATWPFSLKLLWAPIVDSVYSESFGRRKTWMVPAQIAIGIILLYMAQSVEGMVQARDVYSLTLVFFFVVPDVRNAGYCRGRVGVDDAADRERRLRIHVQLGRSDIWFCHWLYDSNGQAGLTAELPDVLGDPVHRDDAGGVASQV